MTIEDEVFKRCKIELVQLLKYGFKKEGAIYKYSIKIMNDTFKVDITVDENKKVKGKIYDLAFDEEYTNYRVDDQIEEFVNKVRMEFQNILNDIREKCTMQEYFISQQANRITNLIKQDYNDNPEFIWSKFPGYGIFRNPKSNKWYGIILNINKSKLDNENKEVEIINVKLNPSKIQSLLSKKGFYKAYHMNKENWISIILDDTISDYDIMCLVKESHMFTDNSF